MLLPETRSAGYMFDNEGGDVGAARQVVFRVKVPAFLLTSLERTLHNYSYGD